MNIKTKIEQETPFKSYITKAIEQKHQNSQQTLLIVNKKITSCIPKTAVLPNFMAHQLDLAGPK